jgi:DNA helicase IV
VGIAHRLKGLEFDSVVLVIDTASSPEARLYVGVSRAVMELVVTGQRTLGERLGRLGE